jgi:hypothetical protein
MSRSLSCRTTSSAASVLTRVIVSSRPALTAAGEAAAVDVDHRQRLGVVDDQVAAGRQVDPPHEGRLDLLVDPPFLQQRLRPLVQLDFLDQLRRGALEEAGHPVELLGRVDHRFFEVAEEDVT